MEIEYDVSSKVFKALSDSNRIKIIKLLSSEEQCACKLLEHFNLTQPTLSHHMKVLIDCGLVISRKKGTWNYYSLNINNCNKIVSFLNDLISKKEICEGEQ